MSKAILAAGLIIFSQSLLGAQPGPKKIEASRCHVFIDYENIWTFEMVQNHEGTRVPILNIITFTPGQWDMKPNQVHVVNAKNKEARIDKFSMDTGIAEEPYISNSLKILGNGFIGIDLMGNFDDFGEPTKVFIDLGDQRFELTPMDCMEFDMLAEQINKINVDSPGIKDDYDVLKITHHGTKTAKPKR
jgi:hypothetical protein